MRARDLETLEFPRVLDAIAALARSAAGRQAVLALRPTSDAAEAERRLDLLAELVALEVEAGRPPTADVPLLAPALAAAAPEGATLEPRRLVEVRDLLAAARQVRAYLRRDPARFSRLAAEGEAIDPVPEVAQPLAAALDETGLVRDDASPALAAARAVTRELRGQMEARLLGMVRDPEMASVIGEQYVTVRNGRFVVPIRTAAAGGFAGVVQDRSASGETVFMEPLFAVELNNRLLLATKDEEAEERRVRGELTALVRTHAARLEAAEGSRLPLCSAVLVDIGDEQSIDRDLSTFTGHIENLAGIAAAASPGTLVLLDEPGAGTDPVEGAALAVGLLTDLLARGPRVVFTSHFPQVKTFALAEPALDVAAFDVDPTTGAPRFKLAYHTVGQSLALPIARRHGLPARALETAERLLTGESRDLARAVARLEESRRAYEADREEVERERARLAAARVEAEALAEDLRARQRRSWAEDLDASRRFLRELEARGRTMLEELRRRPEPAVLRTFVREASDEIAAQAEATQPEASPTRPPVPGDLVEVAGRGIRGELVEIAGERARIQRGGLRFEVPSGQLRVVGDAPARERVAIEVDRPADAPAEINLIGQRVRDAIDALGAFLDRAVRAGLSEVRVVHGIGSGALRRAVHEFLESSPYCAGFRESEPAAGGAGVTIAELG